MNLIKAICIIFILSPCVSYADVLSQGLSQSLTEFRDSVEQLSESNKTMALKNTQFKASLNDFQIALQKLQADNQQLTKDSLKLQETNPARAKQMAQLEKDQVELGIKIKDVAEQLKVTQESIAAKQKEDQQLDDQIRQILNTPVASAHSDDSMSPELSELWKQKQKEKLALLKIISEAQDHQKMLHEQILDFQKIPPVAAIKGSNQKSDLEAQVQQLQQEIAQLDALASHSSTKDWDEGQMSQLQENVSSLEKNRDELQKLVAKMQQKAQRMPLTEDQKNEQVKLRSNIDQLKKETKNLKFDLKELQQQMVRLDKRKAYLETFFKNK